MPMIFVAMTTLASSYVAQSIASSTQLLGSDTGIPNARPDSLFGFALERGRPMLVLTILVLTVSVLAVRRLLAGGFGILTTALRENEELLHDAGFPVGRLKVVTFTISGAVAGLAGCTYASNVGFVSPGSLGFELSTLAVVWVLAGGAGLLVGAMYGVMLVEYLTRYLSSTWVGWTEPILGIMLLLVVLCLRSGAVGLIFEAPRWLPNRASGRQRGEEAPA
jgi:branched-chain amino acid transport system permease protein